MATALQITEAFLADILAKLQDVNTPPTADETSNLLNQYQTLTQLIRDGYQWTSEDLEDLPATLRAELDVWKDSNFNDTGWLDLKPYLLGSWMEHSSLYPIQYRKVRDIVFFRGLINGGLDNLIFSNLPSVIRPSSNLLLPSPGISSIGNVSISDPSLRIYSDGSLTIGVFSTSWTSISCSYIVN